MSTQAIEKAGLRKVFCVRLGRVLSRLGLSKEGERALRVAHLRQGVDWEEVSNGVWYSEAGLEGLTGLIAAGTEKKGAALRVVERREAIGGDGQVDAPPEGPGANGSEKGAGMERRIAGLLTERTGEAVGAPFLVRTLKCHFPNTRVVEVQMDVASTSLGPSVMAGAAMRGFMTVRDSENFLPGMLCWARVERGMGTWSFMGRGDMPATASPVGPRSRGRW